MRKITFSIGEYYHCYNRGTDKRKIFISDKDRLRFITLLYVCNSSEPIHISNFQTQSVIELFDLKRSESLVAIGAWVLMPNHFHIYLKEIKENGISLFMQKLTTGYTMFFNKKFKRTGSLFESTFKAEHVDEDVYSKYLFSYIHLNPVKLIDSSWKEKGIKDWKKTKKFLEDYQWSSYLDFKDIIRPQNKILNLEEFPEYFKDINDFDSEIKEWVTFNDIHGKV